MVPQVKAMHVDYINIKEENLKIEILMRLKDEKDLFEFIKNETSRNKILTFIDNNEFELIAENTVDGLCKKIALSENRTGAIIIDDISRSPLFYKKIREISSAENAKLILKLSHFKDAKNIIRYASPDYIVLDFKGNLCLGSCKNDHRLSEISI